MCYLYLHYKELSIRHSTQGSSIRIDKFVFRSTLNSKKLDEKVKILGIKLCQLFQSHLLVASRLLGSDFVGGEMTVNQRRNCYGPVVIGDTRCCGDSAKNWRN